VGEQLRLDGNMIPRQVKRLFDQRDEPRSPTPEPARLEWRGASLAVQLANISPSGAMIRCEFIPQIGEAVRLGVGGEQPAAAVVRWVRDGRIGLHFTSTVG
jgi:hypothetical protein